MRLESIKTVDKRWPAADRDCLEYFHRHRTIALLFDALMMIGEEKFREVNQYFGIIDASGYTLEEIKNHESRILIQYLVTGTSGVTV